MGTGRGLNNHYVRHSPYRRMVMIGRREAGGGGNIFGTRLMPHLLAEYVRSRGGVADANPAGRFKAGAGGEGVGEEGGARRDGRRRRREGKKLCCDDYFLLSPNF